MNLSQEQKALLGLREDTAILAGAGAGKTTALASSVADALLDGVPAREICLATFTRAAAADVRARVQSLLPSPDLADGMWAGTIDSILLRFLREEGPSHGWGLPRPRSPRRTLAVCERRAFEEALLLVSQGERKELQDIIHLERSQDIFLSLLDQKEREGIYLRSELDAEPDAEPFLVAMSELLLHPDLQSEKQIERLESDIKKVRSGRPEGVDEKSWGITRKSLQEPLQEAIEARNGYLLHYWNWRLGPAREATINLLERFEECLQAEKEKAEARDYGDIMKEAEKLLELTGPLFRILYIDEAQDTNPDQYRTLRKMADGGTILIGDINQAIYGFRGASPQSFKEASQGEALHLRDNYRSRAGVLRAISALTSSFSSLRPIEMQAKREEEVEGPDAEVLLFVREQSFFPSAEKEAAAAVPEIIRLAHEGGFDADDIGVLVRSNTDAEKYVRAFRAHGQRAFAMRRGRLLHFEECKDLLALFRVFLHRSDEEAWIRVLSSPLFAYSDEKIWGLFAAREEDGLWSVLRKEEPRIAELFARAASLESAWADRLRFLAESLRFDLFLGFRDGTGTAWQNCLGLFEMMRSFQEELGPDGGALLEALDGSEDEGQSEAEEEGIRVMTVHQAKGGEFPFLVATRFSRNPHRSADRLRITGDGKIGASKAAGKSDQWFLEAKEEKEKREREEEERLFYVALTRARDKLVLVLSGKDTKKDGRSFSHPANLLPQEILFSGGGEEKVGDANFQVTLLPEAELPEREVVASEGADGVLPVFSGALAPAGEGSLSYTRLASWQKCSLRRHLERDLLLPAAEEGEGEGRRQLGIEVHQRLAGWPWTGDLAEGATPEAESLLRSFAGSDIYKEAMSGNAQQTEVPFSLLLSQGEVVGFIDMLFESREGWEIVDWKTGEEREEDDLLQREIYSLALLLAGRSPVRARTYFMKNGTFKESRFGSEDLPDLRALVEEKAEAVLASPPLPAAEEPQPFCSGCPGLQVMCPVSAHKNKSEENPIGSSPEEG